MKLLNVFLSSVVALSLFASAAHADGNLTKEDKISLLKTMEVNLAQAKKDLDKAHAEQTVGGILFATGATASFVTGIITVSNLATILSGQAAAPGEVAAKILMGNLLGLAGSIGVTTGGGMLGNLGSENAKKVEAEISKLEHEIGLYRQTLMQIQE